MKERSLFANSAWGMMAHGLRGLVGLGFIPLVIHQIGITGYGLYAILMLFSFYQGLVAQVDLGYPGFLLNLITHRSGDLTDAEVEKKIRGFLSFLLAACAVIAAASFVFVPGILRIFRVPSEQSADFTAALGLVLAANFFSLIFSVLGLLWVARHRNAYLKKLETSSYFLFIALAIGLLLWQPGLASLAAAFFLSQVFLALVLWVQTKKAWGFALRPGAFHPRSFMVDWPQWRPFLFFRLNGVAQRQTDVTFVSVLLGPQFVAIYEISMKVPGLIKGLMGRISEVLTPFAGQRRGVADLPYIRTLTQKLVSLQVAFGCFFVINVGFFGADLCQIWLGPEQRSIGVPFFIASFLNLVLPPASVLLAVLMGQAKRTSELTWWPTWISLANLVLTIPVTYWVGVKGTIFLTVLQFAALSVMAMRWAFEDFGFRLGAGIPQWGKVVGVSLVFCLIGSRFLPPVTEQASYLVGFLILQASMGLCLLWLLRKDIFELRTMMAKKASTGNLNLS